MPGRCSAVRAAARRAGRGSAKARTKTQAAAAGRAGRGSAKARTRKQATAAGRAGGRAGHGASKARTTAQAAAAGRAGKGPTKCPSCRYYGRKQSAATGTWTISWFASAQSARASPRRYTQFRRAGTTVWKARSALPQRMGPQTRHGKCAIVKANRVRRGEYRIGGLRDLQYDSGLAIGDWRLQHGLPRKRKAKALSEKEGDKWVEQGCPPVQGPEPADAYRVSKGVFTCVKGHPLSRFIKKNWDGRRNMHNGNPIGNRSCRNCGKSPPAGAVMYCCPACEKPGHDFGSGFCQACAEGPRWHLGVAKYWV